ncbi:MAG TPA: CPBP family glutamic-type intramembrane protease [Gaiellaceae bacterium]|nr:CPBP family glutamic-type intramembrane protease [Gaiellaceae bacterium]
MIGQALPPVALGPATGAATFLILTGGRFPRALPQPLGRATVVRWLALGTIGVLEEVAWRGVLLAALLLVVGPWTALSVTSIGFAAWHWPALRGHCVVHLVTGAAFGAAFLAGGLVAAILGHVLYNILVDWAVHSNPARLRGP